MGEWVKCDELSPEKILTLKYMLMAENELAETKTEKALGVIVSASIKMSIQCVSAMKKANSLLGVIRKRTENKTANIL